MADDFNTSVEFAGATSTKKLRSTELSGAIHVQHTIVALPRTANVTSESMSDSTSAPLAAANPNRASLVISNESDGVLYVKEGAGASSVSYSWTILPGETKELLNCYQGVVEGRLASGASPAQARVTEREW